MADELKTNPRGPGVEETPPQGISAFVARVLNQLTLSAWLPGAVLASGLAVLLKFRQQDNLSVNDAMAAIAKEPLTVLVLAVPVLILATVFTQAFSFEAIRALEGYWSRRVPATWLRTALTRIQLRRKHRLQQRRIHYASKAFQEARIRLIEAHENSHVILALEADAIMQDRPEMSDADNARADLLGWRAYCSPWDMEKITRCELDHQEYPHDSRLLPTRLGNLIRATEDSLEHAEGDVESFALRRRGQASPRVIQQHDQFRTRLDMYATLVFVSWLLAATSLVVLAPLGWSSALIVAGIFLLMGSLAHRAAISSARGYCQVLTMMDK